MGKQALHVNMNIGCLTAQSGGVFACCYAHILPLFKPVRMIAEYLLARALSLMDGREEVI